MNHDTPFSHTLYSSPWEILGDDSLNGLDDMFGKELSSTAGPVS